MKFSSALVAPQLDSGKTNILPFRSVADPSVRGVCPLGLNFNILVFLLLSSLLSSIIFVLSFVLSSKADDIEKISAYECGFNPFEDSRNEFDIRFYVVAILFLIFDLEISFLFPFAVSFDTVGLTGLASMLIFLFILTLGFVYEWKKGALDWD